MIDEIRHRLAAYTPRLLENEGRNRAAVLVPLYFDRGELHVVFTKRTDRVQSHRGEVSFPGGAMDRTDPDLTLRRCVRRRRRSGWTRRTSASSARSTTS